MVDPGKPRLPNVGEELRRIIGVRRRRRRRLALAALVGCAMLLTAVSILWKAPILLLWNASSSAPIGLYRISGGQPVRRGDMVIAWTPEPSRSLAAMRHYLPANVPLVKRIAAAAGDQVCAKASSLFINGKQVARRRTSDPSGRRMPWWNGCRELGQGEYFLLMDSPASFDGRYFGITRKKDLAGRAVPLWARPAKYSNDG